MDDITAMVIKTSLRDMFKRGHLSVSTIRDCLELAGVTPNGLAMKRFSALHCVSFSDMPEELAKEIPRMIVDLFDGGLTLTVDGLFAKEVVPEPQPKLRLFGRR